MAKAGVKRKIANKANAGNAKRPNNKNGQHQQQQPNFEAQQFGNPGFISFDQRQQPSQNQKPNGNRNQMTNRNGGGIKRQWGRNDPNNGFPMNMNRPPMPPMVPPFRGPIMGGPPHPPPPHMFPPRGPFPPGGPQRLNGKFSGKPMPMRGPMGPPFMPPWRPPMHDNMGPQRPNMNNRRPIVAVNKGKGKKRKDPYSLDEPWVTAELREIDTKKKDIQAKLKGVKNDVLFEEFRKLSALFKEKYDAAKLEHIGKQPSKDDKSVANKSKAGDEKKPIKNANANNQNPSTTTTATAASPEKS